DSTVDIFTFYVPHRHVYGEQWIKFMKDGVNATPLPTVNTTGYIDHAAFLGCHDGGYYTVKGCVTIDVLPRTPGNNVYVGFMVWSNFTATKCRGLVSLNQVIKEIICLQPLK